MQDFVGTFQLDRSSPVPAYYQLEEWLTQRIEGGELAPGTRLPSERELAERLGISRMTLRQALDRLAREGLLVRRQGRGAFVGPRRLVGAIGELRGISEEVAAQSRASKTRVLGVDEAQPPRLVQDALALPPLAPAIRARRLRFVDGEPFSLETSWLHPDRCRAVLATDLTDRSLSEVLRHDCELELTRGHERITATVLDAFESEQLGAPEGSAAFRVQRTTWEANGAPVELVISVLRGDRFSFEAVFGQPGVVERTPVLARDSA
jgi:GntR family transcriptional regulator